MDDTAKLPLTFSYLTFSHVQKDDSLLPYLPYAGGCFLASVFLTFSGIIDTHPQALALATYCIQLGWLILQIQGATLVERFGTRNQAMTLFKVWLVAMQFLDVNRRFLSSLTGGAADAAVVVSSGLKAIAQQEGVVATALSTYYRTVLCSTLPTTCQSIGRALLAVGVAHSKVFEVGTVGEEGVCGSILDRGSSSPGTSPLSSSPISTWTSPTYSTSRSNITNGERRLGMKEMEYHMLFEIVAGLGVSGLMVLVWLVMALRQGTGSIKSVRQLSVFLHHYTKVAKGNLRQVRGIVESQVDACIEKVKRVI
ncbi:hypothetical protein CPB97_002783 [Podila verticillata]|nr:hypothetical protein CPB97_002783 [Podila verticillata]